MEQKKFMDISRIKEDTELTAANTGGFHVGDHIVIQEKVDGSNVSIDGRGISQLLEERCLIIKSCSETERRVYGT